MKYNISSDDVKLIEKFIDIRNRGYYCSGKEVTAVYNRVLNKQVSSTQCAACLRGRISELENALRQFKKDIELQNQNNEKVEEVKEEPKPKKTVGRKKNAVK